MTEGSRLRLPTVSKGATEPENDSYSAYALPATFGEYLPMVELRLKTGERVALPYPWLGEVRLDPSAGLRLTYTTGASVLIRGRNLGPVFTALLQHQAVYVWEADRPTAELHPAALPLVESIRITAAPAATKPSPEGHGEE